MQHGKSMAKNLKSQRIRIDEPAGGDQEMDVDELDADESSRTRTVFVGSV